MMKLKSLSLAQVAYAAFFFACAPAAAQWQVPDNAVPVGRGGNAQGFRNVPLPSGSLLIGQPGIPMAIIPTGDVTLNAAGVTAIGAGRVTNSMLAGSIAASKLVGTDISTLGTITAGVWNGTDIAVADGGTGSSTAAGARTNLGLAIGSNVQAWDADLDCLAALSGTGILRRTGAGTCSNGAITSIAEGGTGQTTAPAARASTALNVDSFTGRGDANYTILATDRTVGTNAAFTASRTWTLPAANAVNAGQEIIVSDFQGTVTGSNTLVIARAGSDTINGVTSVTVTSANGAYLLRSDGISKWTAQALGAAAAGGVSSVTCGTGLTGGTITTSGTCNVAAGAIETAWASWTPTISAGGGTFTSVSCACFYKTIGKTTFIRGKVTITTIGTASGVMNISPPVNAQGPAVIMGVDNAVPYQIWLNTGNGGANSSTMVVVTLAGGGAISQINGNGAALYFSGVYEGI